MRSLALALALLCGCAGASPPDTGNPASPGVCAHAGMIGPDVCPTASGGGPSCGARPYAVAEDRWRGCNGKGRFYPLGCTIPDSPHGQCICDRRLGGTVGWDCLE